MPHGHGRPHCAAAPMSRIPYTLWVDLGQKKDRADHSSKWSALTPGASRSGGCGGLFP